MDYFPQALASGQAFCNRVDEQKNLKRNIIEARPTLISSPRRYGKTSLALQTISHSKLQYAHFDFLSAVSINDIEKIILDGIGDLLTRLEKGPRKALKIATDFFSGLNIKLVSDAAGLSIEINKSTNDPSKNILDILHRIEKLSQKYDKKIVLLFDEFQRLYQVAEDSSVESVMRQVAQKTKNISFIFSGSNRHLLNKMFGDRNRPFYKLCDRITLERIDEEDYIHYIQAVAQKTKTIICNDVIDKIFFYTERHPYYMNLLCFRLWRLDKITAEDVERTWQEYAFEERSQVANELDLISNGQRKLLAALARSGGTDKPCSKEFQLYANMAGATIAQALKSLEKNDYIYYDKSGHVKVLDPIIKFILED